MAEEGAERLEHGTRDFAGLSTSRLELRPVSPSVLCVRRRRYLSASYIVHDADGVVLIDTGMEPDGSDMLAGLSAVGATVKDVTAILLTHWHNDHSSGTETIRRASGATVYYHEEEAPNFRHTAVSDWRRKLSDALPEHGPISALKALVGQSPPQPIAQATTIVGGELLEGRFRALHTPGHCRGHTSYLYEPESVVFAGDAIAVCFERLWFMSRFLTDDLQQARESMRRVAELDVTAFCPGHRGPLLDPAGEKRAAILEYLGSGKRWPWLS